MNKRASWYCDRLARFAAPLPLSAGQGQTLRTAEERPVLRDNAGAAGNSPLRN